jgi:hypothetical protein
MTPPPTLKPIHTPTASAFVNFKCMAKVKMCLSHMVEALVCLIIFKTPPWFLGSGLRDNKSFQLNKLMYTFFLVIIKIYFSLMTV